MYSGTSHGGYGLAGVLRGKRSVRPSAGVVAAGDCVNRQFVAERPDQLWVVDFTYVSTWQGFVYVAFIIDVFAGYIVGGGSHRLWKRHSCWMRWSRRCGPVVRLAPSITAIKALSMCHWPIRERLKEAGLLASTGSTGDSYDNAMAESINGLYKAEVIHRKSWKTVQKWNWPH